LDPALSNLTLPTPSIPTQADISALATKAVASKPIYIDTETTGLEKTDEIVEISIIDWDGSILLQSLVKPIGQIPAAATKVHGIENVDVLKAPAWPILWPRVRSVLFRRVIAAYNAPFDLRMMQQTHTRYRLPWRDTFEWLDVMALYARYRGVWDSYRKSMRFFSLEDAGNSFAINLKNTHRATADSLLTRAVLHSMAGEPY
jgi:DNA polymerase III subunit epsilon